MMQRNAPIHCRNALLDRRPGAAASLSLAKIAELLTILNVRCTKCDRRGRYRISTLIERCGADFAGPDLREKLSEGCETS